jgi:hypothetical protein
MQKPKRSKKKIETHWPQIVWGDLPDIASVYRFRDFDSDSHKVPKLDLIDHVPSCNCPCVPVLDLVNEQKVPLGIVEGSIWIHRVIDENPV